MVNEGTKPTPPFNSPGKIPAQPAPKATSTEGKRNSESGGMTYKTGGGMIRVSRILRGWWGRENPNTVPPQDPEDTAAQRQI
jgi:hypothetical protein